MRILVQTNSAPWDSLHAHISGWLESGGNSKSKKIRRRHPFLRLRHEGSRYDPCKDNLKGDKVRIICLKGRRLQDFFIIPLSNAWRESSVRAGLKLPITCRPQCS